MFLSTNWVRDLVDQFSGRPLQKNEGFWGFK